MPTLTGGEATVEALIAHDIHASAARPRFIDSISYCRYYRSALMNGNASTVRTS